MTTSVTIRTTTAAPASNTPEAALLLKLLLAAHAAGAPDLVKIQPPAADSPKVKRVLISVSSEAPADFFEANAVVRLVAGHSSAKVGGASVQNLAIEAAIEAEEGPVSTAAAAKSINVDALLTVVEPVISAYTAQAPSADALTIADIVLFGALYSSLTAVDTADLRSSGPATKAWFDRVSAHPATVAALSAWAAATTKVVQVARPKATVESRRVRPDNVSKYGSNAPNDGHVVLPKDDANNILITSALPYVNNIPHLGNLIGSTLSADSFARYARLRKGNNVIFIGGTDEYGTATETQALKEGVTCAELCDKYRPIHQEVYDWFALSFNKHGRTTTPEHSAIAKETFLKIHNNGYTLERPVTQLRCQTCRRFLADRFVEGTCPKCGSEDGRGDQCDSCGQLLDALELINPRCKLDGGVPVPEETKHIFFDLAKLQSWTEEFIASSSAKGGWSPNGVQITNNWLKMGLQPRSITRDLSWGVDVPLPGYEGRKLYVWIEAVLGYPSITSTYTPEWRQWWFNPDNVKLYQFLGKDNVPFHSIIFPCIQQSSGDKWTQLHHLSSTEYLQYEGGKFSKSKGRGVNGAAAIETGIPMPVWRYVLLANRPETGDSSLSWRDLIARNNSELLANVGNFVNRVLRFVDAGSKYNGVVPGASPEILRDNELIQKFIADTNTLLTEYIRTLDAVHIRSGIKLAMEFGARGNQFLQDAKLDNALFSNSRETCDAIVAVAVNFIYLLAAILEPFVPSTAESIYQQLNAPARYISDTFEIEILEGHVIGAPQHLFQRLDESLAEVFRQKYGGATE
ncbi:methionyl-tRNA synthetase [Ramicandelaber brevisporus]|nr:methionyl-tRNA synthetase [Ramicandelaber brevisporus]